MTIFGYARVSTDGQTLDAQRQVLAAAGATKIFAETASGAQSDRRELAKAMHALGSGDTLLVTRLDRLARSTRDLLNTLDSLSKIGASFRSLSDQWADTTTAHGRLMLTVLGGLAEFERDLIRVRTGEGRVRAIARGQHMGRPNALTQHQREEAIAALQTGRATQADLARSLNVSQATISRLAAKSQSAPTPSPLDSDTERAARAFMRHLAGRYPVREAILFGSRARHTHKPDSDADIAVVMDGMTGDRFAVSRDMAGIAFDVMMETNVRIDPLPLWEDELAHPERFTNPKLIDAIKREGVRL